MARNLCKLVASLLMLSTSLYSFSETVAIDEARSIATEFISTRSGVNAGNISPEPAYTAVSGSNPLYYVFNMTDNRGFVIVSAESSATPVIGYSFESPYVDSQLPQAMQWMMAGLEREIKEAPSMQVGLNTTERLNMVRKAAAQSLPRKVLETPAWSQEAPFNSMIPGRPLVGCVGTAMATVMKYHQWPASGTGSFDGVDFNVNYDWSSMRSDNYRSGYTATEGEAVAMLMYHASKSIDTQYAMSGSSAYEVRVPAALSNYFGYDPGVSYKKRSEVATQQAWDEIVKAEIDANRPVIYCGQDVTAGHAFVCDGYEGDYLHFNWGWGGSANGFFLSTALNPTVSITHHYNNLNTIIYNIKPVSGSVTAWSPIHITADGNQVGIGSDLTDLSSGKPFTVRVGNLKNLSYSDFSGKIAVVLFGSNGAMKTLLCTPANFSLQSMGTLFNGYIDFSNCILPADTNVTDGDVIRIATLADDTSSWLPVAGELPTVNELATKVAVPASFSVTLPSATEGVSVVGEPSVILGWNYSFTVKPDNEQDDVLTVKANGYVLTPTDYTYTIANVRENQNISIRVQKAADVKEKRSIWVGTPGTLADIITEEESGVIKELTLFGSVDARDFAFIRNSMRLTRLDLSAVYISAHGSDQANAIPREAFRGIGSLNEVVLPKSVNRLNNGCFRQCGITTITIPAGVKTYEYNIFVADSKLRDIYVGREAAEFINWCVLSGVRVNELTLHVPSERARINYSNAENWNTIANIIVDPIVQKDEAMFAVMDNAQVKFDSANQTGLVTKGTTVAFTADYIADSDNRMDVYANSTLLTPDAEGVYRTTVADNTIIHFDLVAPLEIDHNHNSPWVLNDKNGSIGMFTDAVNVIPGQEFTIRVNALHIPVNFDQFFWAAALTDAQGNIKEFISPVNLWTAGPADNHKFNVVCCVRDSKVREGNTIRLVTSANKKVWQLVSGSSDEIVDALPVLNNMSEIFNINVPEVADATISGLPESGMAVRGRDITMKINPNSAAYRIDLSVNGVQVFKNQTSISYTFVVMEDMNFDIDVYDPKAEGVLEMTVAPGTFHVQLTEQNVCATVIVKGEVYSSDIQHATGKDFAIKTIKTLDLRGVKIVKQDGYEDNVINHPFFVYPNGMNTPASVIENILLPDNVVRIAGGVFKNCANIKEITLPKDLRSVPVKPQGSNVLQYGLANSAFAGCTSLTTIRIPGDPGEYNGRRIVAHHNPYSTTNSFWYDYYNLGHEDPKKVTVIVPEEHLSVYTTAYNESNYGNPWKGHGYNILSEYPVYGVNFDPTRIKAEEGVDVSAIASFLGDNVTLESIVVEGKLKLVNPELASRVYDNGKLIERAADGAINIEFLNPAKNTEGAGNHNLSVVYAYDLEFNSTSPLFSISEPEVINEAGFDFQTYDDTDSQAPVLKNIAEKSTVRFRVGFASEHTQGLEARVMSGLEELMANAEGLYTVEITNTDKTIEIFAVPAEGATLNSDEIAALNPEESAAVTSIALSGEFTEEEFAQALSCFPSIENLDLSDYLGELPEGAFAGMTSLTTITVPEVDELGANMFNGCSSLESVDVPSTVNVIGEGAFKDCTSLESVRLTGITEIGDEAFSGCDNMTSITLLSASSDGNNYAPAKVPRAAAIDAKAFKGLNPNCIVVVDEGAVAPGEGVNYIITSVGTVTETLEDGTVVEREGRIYTAPCNIALTSGHRLAIPHAFTLGTDATISLQAEKEEWDAMVVPFDTETISNDEGKKVDISIINGSTADPSENLLFTLGENVEAFVSTNAVKANVPFVFHTEKPLTVVFTATEGKIPATPAEIRVDGKEFSLHAAYAPVSFPAAETFLLSDDAKAFVAAGTDDETADLVPFAVYATTPAAVTAIATNLPDTSGETSTVEPAIDEITTLTVQKDGDNLVIYSPDERTEIIYTIDGRAAAIIHILPGKNVVSTLSPGYYIISNIKIRL